MAYHLDPDLPLTDSVRAVARDQIGRALKSLGGADDDLEEAVHDLRKRCKKLRGLLRIVRPGLEKTYAKENTAFRDLARTFSDIRDAQVLSETIDKLAEASDGEAAAEQLGSVRHWAAGRRQAVLAGKSVEKRIDAAAGALEKADRRAATWDVDDPPAALAGGLRKTYKRARNRWQEAVAEPSPELLHEWRKRTKYHWYHCRLLREAWPDSMAVRADALDSLGDALGDDHDLVVLVETLRADRPSLPPATRDAVEALAARRSQKLRAEALTQAPRLFVERPKDLVRRLSAQWSLAAVA